jgi:2-polyprenyl-6-methoxyphenol hydroxylase-like FAD-dependent oxidoreductase
MEAVDVVVCGAGVAGLVLAWRLQEAGHQVVVVEQNLHLRDGGYMIDFFGPGFTASERLGLLPDIAAIHYPVEHLVFVDGSGRRRLELPYPTLRKRWFVDRHFNVMRGDLVRLLHARLRPRTVRFGLSVGSFEDSHDGVRIAFTDGSTMRSHVLVGADGTHSRIRRLTFGPESVFLRPLGFRALAFVAGADVAKVRDFVTLSLPRRQVAVYPVREGVATFFLSQCPVVASDGSPRNPCQDLQTTYGDLDWIVPTLIDACRQAATVYVDDVAQVEMRTWSCGHVVLVGDACQCVSLVAGQGASLAMFAALVLAEELCRCGPTVGALTRYQERVQPIVVRTQKAARQGAAWFVPRTRTRLVLRNLVLRASLSPLVASLVRRQLAA